MKTIQKPFTPAIFPDAFADYPQTEARIPYLENQLAPYTSAVTGVKGIPLAAGPGNNTWISGIILSCFILVALTYRTASKQMAQILYSIFGAGTERTAFISKNNVGVVRLKLVLLLQTDWKSVGEGKRVSVRVVSTRIRRLKQHTPMKNVRIVM